MKNCLLCRHARWKRNSAGALHPSGDGVCTKVVTLPPLPACRSWIIEPQTNAPGINRNYELPRHCAYYEREKS